MEEEIKMIVKYKNKNITNLYKVNYENLSDLCNIREVIFHNSVKHYNFNKHFIEVSKYEFEDLYNNYELSNKKYLLVYRTKSNKLFEIALYNLSLKDKQDNSAFLHALGTR